MTNALARTSFALSLVAGFLAVASVAHAGPKRVLVAAVIDGENDGGDGVDEVLCNVSDGVCGCTTGADRANPHAPRWECASAAATCPRTRPLIGQACSEDVLCDYGACTFRYGVIMRCVAGSWVQSGEASCR